MNSVSNFLNIVANWKTLLATFVIYLLFNVYFLKNAEEKINELAGSEIGVIDLTFGFDPQKTLDMVAKYGEAARSYYAKTEMTTDLIYPIVYAFFFGIALTLVFRSNTFKPFERVNILPFFSLGFDYLENGNIVYLLKTFPEQCTLAATLCELFKLLKWLSFGAVLAIIVFGLARNILSKK